MGLDCARAALQEKARDNSGDTGERIRSPKMACTGLHSSPCSDCIVRLSTLVTCVTLCYELLCAWLHRVLLCTNKAQLHTSCAQVGCKSCQLA